MVSPVGGTYTIESIMDEGNLIKMDDGSLWQVSPFDVSDTAIWLESSEITVIQSKDPAYPYKLINADEHETVHARLLRQ